MCTILAALMELNTWVGGRHSLRHPHRPFRRVPVYLYKQTCKAVGSRISCQGNEGSWIHIPCALHQPACTRDSVPFRCPLNVQRRLIIRKRVCLMCVFYAVDFWTESFPSFPGSDKPCLPYDFKIPFSSADAQLAFPLLLAR